MKKTLTLLSFGILLSLGGFAQGIIFSKLSYEDALSKAKAENKGIYIDVYTSWCGPCKQMAREIFPLKEVGDYFNQHFVSLQLDAEKEADHGFFKTYKASAYPTSVWLDKDGQVLNVEVGLLSAKSMLDRAANAADSKLQEQNREYAKRWGDGDRSLELLLAYVFGVLQKLHPEQVKPHFESYLATLDADDMKDPINSKLVARFLGRKVDGIIFDYIVKYYDLIEKNVGYLNFHSLMYRSIVRTTNVALLAHQEDLYEAHINMIRLSDLPHKEMYLEIIEFETLLNSHKCKEGFNKMLIAEEKYGRQNPYLYREFCYSLVSSLCLADAKFNKKECQALIDLTAKAFELSPCTETITFLAAAYAKAGDYKKAYETELAVQFYPKDKVLPGIVIKNSLKRPIQIQTDQAENVKDMKGLLERKKDESTKLQLKK